MIILEHIQAYATSKGIFIDRLNGHWDHVHMLVSLRPMQSPGKVAQLLKGESSHWINNTYGKLDSRFAWQGEYYAASVDYKGVPALRNYIDRQEMHHKQINVDEELRLLLNKVRESEG